MRFRKEIFLSDSLPVLNHSGGDPQDRNQRILIEILLDIRQFLAGIFIVTNKTAGDPLPTPQWVMKIAKGE